MTTLPEALRQTPRPLLLFIGRQRSLSYSSNLTKAELLDRLQSTLGDPANLQTALASLVGPELEVLTTLLGLAGRLAQRYLSPRYGQIRPLRLLPKISQTETASLSPLEHLLTLGLIFLHQPAREIFIPADLVPLIQNFMRGEETETRGGRDAKKESAFASSPHLPLPPRLTNPRLLASPIDLLCHDLAYLLALLNRDDVQPLHGRWLPPGTLQAWGRYCAVTPVSPHARSELQTGRRRFIHYLAENAGWIGGQGSGVRGQMPVVSSQKSPISHLPSPISNLSPLPAAWLWLNAPRSERLQTLWQAWTQPDPALWRAYRLPGHDWLTDPARLITVVNGELEEWKNGRMDGWNAKREEKIPTFQPSNPPTLQPSNLPTFQPAALLNRHPYLLDLVPANHLDPVETLLETLEQLLTGPLLWLGILGMANSERRMGEEIFSSAAPAYAKFAVETHFAADILDSTLTLTLAGGLPEPADLMVVMEIGRMKDEGGKKNSETAFPPSSFTLHPSSFIRALQRGWSFPALLDALNRLADRPLTPAETALLHAWSELADRVVLRQVTLLETTEPEVITRLASTRRGRALIQQTLSPRAIVVNPAQLDQLVRRLTEQEGVPPKVQGSGGVKKQGSRAAGEQGSEENKSPLPFRTPAPLPLGSPAHLWLALQVYQRLGRLIRLPVRLPQALLDQVAGQADPTDLAAAESAAEQIMAGLQQAVEGWAAFPPSPEAGLPVEATLPLIKEALATGQNLDLLYYTAGTDRLTHRIVEPHRLEWRGSAAGEQRSRGAGEKEGQSEIVNRKSEIVNPPEARKARSGVPYLVGFCHAAQAERVFRLDRIQEITLVPRPDEDGQIWEG